MATQTKTPVADSTENVIAFNEKTIEETKKAIEESQKARFALLDSYESGVLNAVDSYEEIASATDVDWIKEVVAAQARATRELTKAYVSAARDLESQVLALK